MKVDNDSYLENVLICIKQNRDFYRMIFVLLKCIEVQVMSNLEVEVGFERVKDFFFLM